MKVCKKCKNHVANKAKICKKCGADVSKAKIIKSLNNKNTNQNTKSQTKIKKTNKSLKPKPIVEKESKKENKIVVTNKQNKKQHKMNLIINNQSNYTNKIKSISLKLLSIAKIGIYKLANLLKRITLYILIELFQSIKITSIIIFDFIISFIRFVKNTAIQSVNLLKKVLVYINKKHTEIKQINVDKPKRIKVENPVKKQEIKELKEKKVVKPKKHLKLAFFSLSIISIVSGVYLVAQDVYNSLDNNKKMVVTEKATREKIFNMEDIITYNNVDYKVVKIETSNGNNYKSPKEGNQFLIVTVYIKNNSGKKIPYSYENWTMSNSKGEEKKRIFTSINVDTALYSGELVIGGIKTGSMVFEQPINDSKLKINFYELKKDEDGNEIIDEAKRVFSISVKSPEKRKKERIDNNDDVKMVKNNNKNKSY